MMLFPVLCSYEYIIFSGFRSKISNVVFSWIIQRVLIANTHEQVKQLSRRKWDFPSILILDHNLVPKVQLNISKELFLLSLLSSESGKLKPFSGFLQVFYNAREHHNTYDFGEGLWLLLLIHFPIYSPTDILQGSSKGATLTSRIITWMCPPSNSSFKDVSYCFLQYRKYAPRFGESIWNFLS